MSLIEKPITSLKELQEVAGKIGPRKVAVAVAQEKVVLQAVKKAEDMGLIESILVGDQEKITRMGVEVGWQVPAAPTAIGCHCRLERSGQAASQGSAR